MGLIIQRIEPNGRVYRDARMRVGDRIVEINGTSLIGIDFKSAQIILRDAIQQSNDLARNVSLEFKLVRSQSNLNVEQQYASEQQERPEYEAYDEEQEEINERPIEIEPIGQQIDGENEDSYENNKENNTVANTNNNMSFNHLSSINMNALNTKKMGKIITVQLVKGPQGLGFKLAARDNCASGEFSPIYIKNILPKGAAITDGRLQRGDRLIEVDKMDMTKTTLHEAVNILRNTKLGACVELVVSRQILPNLNNSQTENSYNTSNLIQQQQQNNSNNTNEYHSPHKQLLPREISNETDNTNVFLENDANQDLSVSRRQLLTFEIALNDTGSAGLGVSVKGKTKRIEENDCSVDLGIFIKIVINGGAAFKGEFYTNFL
jgi:partitioning defective protein 3